MSNQKLPLNLDIEIWDLINRYVEICHGDPSEKTISDKRMDQVVKIERFLEKIWSK